MRTSIAHRYGVLSEEVGAGLSRHNVGALVIGASGQVGGALVRAVRAQGLTVVGTCHRRPVQGLIPLDVTNVAEVEALVGELQPGVIYLAAALSAVDYCEAHMEEAWAINVGGVEAVARASARTGAKFVFFSSEYVFDGAAGPYGEDDPVSPLNNYGTTKVEAERVLRALTPDHLIVRTTVVYSWNPGKSNFAMQVWERLSSGQPLRVPNDQMGNPTPADYLAHATVRLARGNLRGTVNVVGFDRVARSEFALRLSKALELDTALVEGIPTIELGQAAPRPLNGGLRTDRITALLGEVPMSLDQGIEHFVHEARAERVAGLLP